MASIILYGSQYGTSKSYAEKLSELTGIPACSFEQAENLDSYDRVVYLGGLYAGGVTGLKQTVKHLSPDVELIVATVGLADVQDQLNVEHIKQGIQSQVPPDVYRKTRFFHLRGGIDYGHLNFRHKMMMAVMYRSLKARPASMRREEDNQFIQHYNQQMDFVDFQSLAPIVRALEE